MPGDGPRSLGGAENNSCAGAMTNRRVLVCRGIRRLARCLCRESAKARRVLGPRGMTSHERLSPGTLDVKAMNAMNGNRRCRAHQRRPDGASPRLPVMATCGYVVARCAKGLGRCRSAGPSARKHNPSTVVAMPRTLRHRGNWRMWKGSLRSVGVGACRSGASL